MLKHHDSAGATSGPTPNLSCSPCVVFAAVFVTLAVPSTRWAANSSTCRKLSAMVPSKSVRALRTTDIAQSLMVVKDLEMDSAIPFSSM